MEVTAWKLWRRNGNINREEEMEEEKKEEGKMEGLSTGSQTGSTKASALSLFFIPIFLSFHEDILSVEFSSLKRCKQVIGLLLRFYASISSLENSCSVTEEQCNRGCSRMWC